MNENIFEKATRLAAAWHAKALNMPRRDCFAPTRSCSIDGLAAEIDRDRDLVEALKGTTLPIATGEDFKFWEDLLFAAGYIRDQILLVLDDGRAVVEADGKAIGHRTFLADDPQVVTTDGANEEVRFQYGADLPESVYVEGDAVFLDFTGRMPAHLHVAGDLSVDRAAANMLPTGTLVGNDLHVFEFLSDVGPIRLPDGLRVNGDVHLPETSEVVFGDRTEIWGDIFGGSDNSITASEWSADHPVPSTGPELSRFALAMESCVEGDVFRGELPEWLSKTQSDEGQAFVVDEGEFRGWVLAVSDGEVLGMNPRHWCRCLAGTEEELCDMDTEEVAHKLGRAFEFASGVNYSVRELLVLTVLPMELPEGFNKDEAVEKGVVMCRADGSCVVDTDDGFEATTLAELGLKARSLTFEELVEAANACPENMEHLKRAYPVPDSLDGDVVRDHDIVAYAPETKEVACKSINAKGYVCEEYATLGQVHFWGAVWNDDDLHSVLTAIQRFLDHSGGIDDGWDWESAGFDVISIERGWQMTLLFGPDEGAVIEVMDGKARVVSVMVEVEIVGPTEDEIEQVGLSLTRAHDGGVPI